MKPTEQPSLPPQKKILLHPLADTCGLCWPNAIANALGAVPPQQCYGDQQISHPWVGQGQPVRGLWRAGEGQEGGRTGQEEDSSVGRLAQGWG